MSEIAADTVKTIDEIYDDCKKGSKLAIPRFQVDTFTKIMRENKWFHKLSDLDLKLFWRIVLVKENLHTNDEKELLKQIQSFTADEQEMLFRTSQDLYFDEILNKSTLKRKTWQNVFFPGRGIVRAKIRVYDTYLHSLARNRKFVLNYMHGRFRYDECSICAEKFQENTLVRELKCGHMFHMMCLREWLSHRTTCPYCRGEVVWLTNFKCLHEFDETSGLVITVTSEAAYK